MAIVQSDEGGASDINDIHSRRGGVFRSEDGGEKWTRMSDINPRPFYFSQIRIDPANDQRVYVLGMALLVSDEGGKNFREDLSEQGASGLSCPCHSAGHDARAETAQTRRQKQAAQTAGLSALAPRNRRRSLSKLRRRARRGNTSIVFRPANFTAFRSTTRSRFTGLPADCRTMRVLSDQAKWRAKKVFAIPIGLPLRAAMDFTSFSIRPIATFSMPKVRKVLFTASIFAPAKSAICGRKPAEGQERYRFHWNAPLIGSQHQPGVLYLAGNRVFRLTNKAEHFKVISPDLTRNEPDKINDGRERRGKLRCHLFVGRIAGESRTSLGWNGRRTALADPKRGRQLD